MYSVHNPASVNYSSERNGFNKKLGLFNWNLLLLVFALWATVGRADPIPAGRRIDWSGAGIRGGIPTNYSVFCNVRVNIPGSSLRAKGNGEADDTTALQAAIDLAPNQSVVFLPAGVYRTTDELNISGKQIIIRGEDSSLTIISNTVTFGNAIKIFQNSYSSSNSNSISGAIEGASSATLKSDNWIPPIGSWCWIGSDSDPAEVIRDGCGDNATYLKDRRQIVQITKVSGSTISFTPPLRWNLETKSPWIFLVSTDNSANRCGLESLGVRFSEPGPGLRSLILISQVQECWVTGCELSWTRNNAIELKNASHCTISSNIIHHAWDYVGGWAYGVWEFDCCSDNLIENNIFYNLRHSYASEGFITGSVIAYNYQTNECYRAVAGTPIDSMSGSFITHAVGAKYLLFEGNVCDRFSMDNIHGSGLKNTIFRNRILPVTHNDDFPDGNISYGCIGIVINLHNNEINVVGNVIGIDGLTVRYEGNTTNSPIEYANYAYMLGFSCDNMGRGEAVADSMVTLLRAVNYDTATKTVKTDAGVADTNLPVSYYLDTKPLWWGNGRWPAIGADLKPMESTIPAQARFAAADKASSNQAPFATASATSTNGAAPLSVDFFSNGSFDPEGVNLSYAWRFGDGATSSEGNPTHVYQAPGNYLAQLTVSDGTNFAASDPISISVVEAGFGLVAAFGFENGEGRTANDTSGNGNSGMLTNATWTSQGKFGKGMMFNGTNAMVVVSSSPSLNVSDSLTQEAWVYPTANQDSWSTILHRETDAYYLHASSPAGPMMPAGGGIIGGTEHYAASASAIPLDRWTHLALTYDGTVLSLFVNGTNVSSREISGAIQTNSNPLRIGGNVPYGQFFQGIIDEVRIYNRALTTSEIRTDMNSAVVDQSAVPPPPSGLRVMPKAAP